MSLPQVLSMLDNTFAIPVSVIAIGAIIYKLLKKRIIKENQKQLTNSFESVVAKISSRNEAERISAAILLRNFFDNNSSLGIGDAPLTKETINVISSMLRISKTSDFQKLLADGLRYAPSLKNSDLQKVNLTNAVLGKKNLDFSGSDFYRANLTNASFKDRYGNGVNLQNTVFYEAILHNTNFTGCDLRNANFYNASFKNTNFNNCKNIPPEVEKYISSQNNKSDKFAKKIFISHPRAKTIKQQIFFKYICDFLHKKGFELVLIEKYEEQDHAILARMQDIISTCSAMIIFNYKQYKIKKLEYRWWDAKEAKVLKNIYSPSAWIYIELGMGVMNKIPLYIISDINSKECILNNINEENILNINNYEQDSLDEIYINLEKWITTIS